MPRYDLHSHSLYSDGVLSPADVVRRAHERGVEVLALTDHDTTDGLAEARAAAAELGLTLVPGVEISVTWAGRLIHVLGLGIDVAHEPLQCGLAALRTGRRERARRVAEALARTGIEGALAGAESYARTGVVGRGHFARFLVEQGHVKDHERAFKRYLGRGARCYVPWQWAALEEAVGWITGAGGAAAVAHPARYRMSAAVMRAFLAEFRAAGGSAIEVASSSHDVTQTQAMARHAAAFDLYASAGSDFHEPGKGRAELGSAQLPSECRPLWEAPEGWIRCRSDYM